MRTQFKRLLLLVVMALAGVAYPEYTWDKYGEWEKVTDSPSRVNEAKRAAIADQRPMLVLYTREGGDCAHCQALWNAAFADGRWNAYAKEKKIILLYINLSQVQDWYTYLKNQFPLYYSGGYPNYAIFHVKDTADCTSENKGVILSPANVDCIGASYYALAAKINGIPLANSFESFKALFESYFAVGMNTYGLSLEPEAEDSGEEINILEDMVMEDFTVGQAKDEAAVNTTNPSVWYSFTAVAGKTYHFRFARKSGSSGVKVGIYANTGTKAAPNYDKTKALLGPQDAFGGALEWTTGQEQAGKQMFVKVFSEETSPNVRFMTEWLSLPNDNHLLNPDVAPAKGKWCGTFANDKCPAVVAYIDDDIWNSDTLALAKAMRTSDFTTAYLFVLKEAHDPKPELVYISKNGKEQGRLSGDFSSAAMERFSQYKNLENDAYEPENNSRETVDEVMTVPGVISRVKLGGVDSVDWYAFQSTANSQKWTFTPGGASTDAISLSITDADGKVVASTRNGAPVSYTVPASGTMMYVKLEADTDNLFDYNLSAEIKAADYTVEFGVPNGQKKPVYTVMANEDSIEIPVLLNNINHQAGAVSVTIKLDNSSFGNGVVLFAGYKPEAKVSWSAGENPAVGDPAPKSVTVYLNNAEDDENWNGEVEKTVVLSFADTGIAESATENAEAVVHIRNVNILTFVGEKGNGSNVLSYETFTSSETSPSQTQAYESCIYVPEKYKGNEIFWELTEGEIPAGVDIDIRQNGNGQMYDVVVSGTAKVMGNASAKILFFIRKEAKKRQIVRGDEFTINFTISEKAEANASLRAGWNLLAIPWSMKTNEEEENSFWETNEGNVFTADGNTCVAASSPLAPGAAYWVYVKKGSQKKLTGIKDMSVDEAAAIEKALEGREWFFGVDPGKGTGWIWDAEKCKFVPAGAKGSVGWWYVR